jgi:hypothetical protein
MNRLIAVAITLILLISCSSSTRSVSFDNTERRPKLDNYTIEILDRANIDKPFKVIGYIEIVAWEGTDLKKTFGSLKAEARKLGGNGLIDIQKGRKSSKQFIWSAKVIIWK